MTPEIAYLLGRMTGLIDRLSDLKDDLPENIIEEILECKTDAKELFRSPPPPSPMQMTMEAQKRRVPRVATSDDGGYA